MRLKDKVALITGATGGMGSACARLFAKEGASVVLGARKLEQARALEKEIVESGGKALVVKLDVARQEDWKEAVSKAKDAFGGLHVLVNVAGVNARSSAGGRPGGLAASACDQPDRADAGDSDLRTVDEKVWRRLDHQRWLDWWDGGDVFDRLFVVQVGAQGPFGIGSVLPG